MACRPNRGSKLLLCVGLFVLASSFCHCTEPTRTQTSNSSVVWTLKSRDNGTLVHGQVTAGATGDMRHGRLLIGRNSRQGTKLKGMKFVKNLLEVDANYQSDMGWEQSEHLRGQVGVCGHARPDGAAVEWLQQMEPKVECAGQSMRLKVHDAASTPGSLFFVNRGSHLSPLPLSKLPPSCGYTMRSTRRDLVLDAPYDGCFVSLEEDSYVLPLCWRGLPIRMSCPIMRPSSPNPPRVTCHAEGVVVETDWSGSVKIKVNLNGQWEPLMKVSARCGFSVVVHPVGVVISARFAPCVEMKDGMFTIILAGDGEIKVFCPALLPLHPKPTQSHAESPNQRTELPEQGVYPSYQGSPNPVHPIHVPPPNPKGPAQPAVPQGSVYPQYPEVSILTPRSSKHPQNPEEPHFPFYPNHFHPYPIKPGDPPRPTLDVQPLPHVTKITDGQQAQQTPAKSTSTPKGQVPQPLNPFPSYPWLAQPDDLPTEPAGLPQYTQPPKAQVEQPLYPYPFYSRPPYPALPAQASELQPIPSTLPPVIQTPKGQIQQPFYPQPPQTTQNPATKGPLGKLQEQFYQSHIYPPLIPSLKPVQPSINQFGGHKHQPFYPYPFYPQPPSPTASEAPQDQVHQPHYPLGPEPEIAETPSPDKPSPGGQEKQPIQPFPFYPYPFYHQFPPVGPFQEPLPLAQHPPNQTPQGRVQQPETPSPGKFPSPGSQEQQPFYPFPFHPHLFDPLTAPETPPGRNPAESPATEPPKGQVLQPFYPQQPWIPAAETNPTESPAKEPLLHTQFPATNVLKDQVRRYFPYPQQPQNPQPVTVLPDPTHKPQVTPVTYQNPQEPASPDTTCVPPVHCPHICPSGFSHCCPQIAFHQHHHHIVPAGAEGGLPIDPGLPFLSASGYSIPGYGLDSAPRPHKQPEATKTSVSTTATSAPENVQVFAEYRSRIASQIPFGSESELKPYFKPPDGNPAALPANHPHKPAEPEQPIHPYFVSYNSQYPKLPYQPQDEDPPHFPQSVSPAHSDIPFEPQVAVSDSMLQYYKLYNLHPPKQPYGQLYSGNMENPSEPKPRTKPNFVSHITQYLQQPRTSKQQNEQTANKLQPPGKKSTESEHLVYQDQSKPFDPQLIPYYTLQDSQAPNKSPTSEPNSSSKSQPPVSDPIRSSKPVPPMPSYSQPSGYVLLQHGPPGREPSNSPESQLLSVDLVHDANNFVASEPQRHHNGKHNPQNLKQPWGIFQHKDKQLGKGMYGLPGNADYMPSPMGEESTKGLPFYYFAPNGPHPASLPQEPSFNPEHLKPEFPESFKDYWKPITPLDSGYRTPPHDHGQPSQRQGPAAKEANGLINQPIQRKGHQTKTQS